MTDGAGQRWMNSYYDNNGAQVEGLHAGQGAAYNADGAGVCPDRQYRQGESKPRRGALSARGLLDSPLRRRLPEHRFRQIGVIALTFLGRLRLCPTATKGERRGILPHGGHVCLCAVSAGSAGGWLRVLRGCTQSCSFEIIKSFPGIPGISTRRARDVPVSDWRGQLACLLYMLTQCYGVRGQNGDLLLARSYWPTSLTPRAPPLSPCALRGDRSPCDTAIPLRWDLASTRPRGRNWTARPCRAARMAC